MNSLAPPTGSGANAPLSKDNKPIFKKWWVWLIVGSVVFYAVMPKISESGSTISTPITNSTQATIAPTTTTTILEKAWNEILNAGIDPFAQVLVSSWTFSLRSHPRSVWVDSIK